MEIQVWFQKFQCWWAQMLKFSSLQNFMKFVEGQMRNPCFAGSLDMEWTFNFMFLTLDGTWMCWSGSLNQNPIKKIWWFLSVHLAIELIRTSVVWHLHVAGRLIFFYLILVTTIGGRLQPEISIIYWAVEVLMLKCNQIWFLNYRKNQMGLQQQKVSEPLIVLLPCKTLGQLHLWPIGSKGNQCCDQLAT